MKVFGNEVEFGAGGSGLLKMRNVSALLCQALPGTVTTCMQPGVLFMKVMIIAGGNKW